MLWNEPISLLFQLINRVEGERIRRPIRDIKMNRIFPNYSMMIQTLCMHYPVDTNHGALLFRGDNPQGLFSRDDGS